MTATDELRRMLDERGVEHYDGTESTLWGYEDYNEFTGIYRFSADETSDGYMQVRLWRVTPEQAIAATLGDADLAAENAKLRELCADLYAEMITYSNAPNYNAIVWASKLRELGVEVEL